MKRKWIIWFAILLHLSWGIQMLVAPPTGGDAHGGISWNIYVSMGGLTFWGIWMILAAFLAGVSVLRYKRGLLPVLMLLPQQAVLAMGAIGIITGFLGTFHEFEISRVIRVMPLSLGSFIFYTLAVLDYHGEELWKQPPRLLSRLLRS